jgi:hypothetical protein
MTSVEFLKKERFFLTGCSRGLSSWATKAKIPRDLDAAEDNFHWRNPEHSE